MKYRIYILYLAARGRLVGIPGELKAYKYAHTLYGRLPWAALFEPTIAMVREGFPVSSATAQSLKGLMVYYKLSNFTAFPTLW